MSKLKSTPGPWFRNKGAGGETYIIPRKQISLHRIAIIPPISSHNADIVIAAPDLYVSLEGLLDFTLTLSPTAHLHPFAEKAERALAKARGKK